jgi:hypothetical protein
MDIISVRSLTDRVLRFPAAIDYDRVVSNNGQRSNETMQYSIILAFRSTIHGIVAVSVKPIRTVDLPEGSVWWSFADLSLAA